ncbi:MAG: type II toxin-antitoxin system VapC family toxin [Candidatus Binatia bacterium]
MYLFDTDTLSNLLAKRPSSRLLQRLVNVPPDQQFTSAITVGELLYGVYKSPRAEYFHEKLEQLVWPRVQIVPFDRQAAEAYGRLRAELEQAGQPLPDADLMIAAIGLARNLVLVTGNVKHFAQVKRLRVENWL